MDFKNKLKNFWRLNAQSAKGFTLVELIVVIAILAILAGIAVPAYSGYVEKANKAADEQLLANVNTAFAAACATNGEDHFSQNPNTTKISLTDADSDGDREVIVLENDNAAIVSSFGDFFEGGEFKVIKDLFYNSAAGGFLENVMSEFTLNGQTIYVSAEEVQKLINSTYAKMGADRLTGQVDLVAGIAVAMLNNPEGTIYGMVYGDDNGVSYLMSMGTTLGYDMATPEGQNKFMSAYETMITECMTTFNCTEKEATDRILANSLILTAAQNSTSMNANDLTSLLTSTNLKSTMIENLDSEATANAGLAQAAVAYGMYTAYLESKGESVSGIENITQLTDALNDDGFRTYVNSNKGQADMTAYLTAMSLIDESANSGAAESVLAKGFSNPELITLLQQVMGDN